ncbi:hypothetical protein OpiT1DRAFT_05673 [Opitutaceae bacterium TAV1]|nr:hypothetical protein OpiT1DRAFT_05673 [Opitutaceae bacterium TAV1]
MPTPRTPGSKTVPAVREKPSRLDRQVHGAVRQILYNEIGYGPDKLRRFLSRAIEAEVRRKVAGAGSSITQTVETRVRSTLDGLSADLERFKAESIRTRDEVCEYIRTMGEDARATAEARLTQAVTATNIELLAREAVERYILEHQVDFKALRERIQAVLEETAAREIKAFLDANFRIEVKTTPGRKILLPP